MVEAAQFREYTYERYDQVKEERLITSQNLSSYIYVSVVYEQQYFNLHLG